MSTQALTSSPNAWRTARATSEPSPLLWSALVDERLHTTHPERLHAPIAGRTFTFGPEHVPAFLPDDLYARHFPDVESGHHKRIRRHVPIALARLVGNFDSARQAGHYLGHTANTIDAATGRVAAALPGGFPELRNRIAAIADELEASPRTNYYRARAAIDHTWLIPNPEWETIRAHILTTGYAKTGIDWPRRHHLHSIWLWTLLTGGDLADAPHVRHASSVNPGTNQTAHATNNLIRRTRQSRRELINDIANDLRATF